MKVEYQASVKEKAPTIFTAFDAYLFVLSTSFLVM